MKLLATDKNVIEALSGENSLLDGNIEKIEIFQYKSICINIYFQMRESSSYERVLLKIEGCQEYNFSYSDEYDFYTVELIKFFQESEKQFYISFDPYDGEETISESDQDFIIFKKITAYDAPSTNG